QVIQGLHELRQSGSFDKVVAVWGKKFPYGLSGIPETRGLNPSILMERLIPLFLKESLPWTEAERAKLAAEQLILNATRDAEVKLPVRTPTFCPGCPHRDSSSVFLEIKKDFLDPAYM